MKKTAVELSHKQIAILLHLIGDKEKEINFSTSHGELSLGISDSLTANFSDDDKKELVTIQVKQAVSAASGIPASNIKEKDDLRDDLHLSAILIRSLAMPSTRIARQFKAGATVSADECEKQDTVQDCIDLIMGKI